MAVRLNEREREVLSWVAKGKSAWEIGTILAISQRTVQWHVAQANRKLGVANTIQTVVAALKAGVIDASFISIGTGMTAAMASDYAEWLCFSLLGYGGTSL